MRPLVEDFSFVLNKGDRAVMIGEEGNGKSTLLKLIYDPALVDSYAEYTGEIVKNHIRQGICPRSWKSGTGRKASGSFSRKNQTFIICPPKSFQR